MHTPPGDPRLLLVTPPDSYRTSAYLAAAGRLRIPVLVASRGEHSLVPEIAEGLHVDLDSPGAVDVLLHAAAEKPFTGVVATDDAAVELGSRIAAELGLPHNPPEAARRSRRKDLSRQALAAAGVGVPGFFTIDLGQPLAAQFRDADFPRVIKPLALSGSRGVIRVNDVDEAVSACHRTAAILETENPADAYLRTHLLSETFVSGDEVAIEGLLHRGRLHVLAVFDKPDPLEGPFFEETYYVTPSRHAAAAIGDAVACVDAGCRALGLREGPVHAEVRLSAAGSVVIEIASRTIGGECARLLKFGTGHDLETLVIAHATGRPLETVPMSGGAGVLMLPVAEAGILRRVEGLRSARAVPGVEEVLVNIREGYELVPLPEGSSYPGFIFSRAETPAAAERALRESFACLEFVVAPVMKLTREM